VQTLEVWVTVFSYEDYRKALLDKVKEARRLREGLTLKVLAEKLRIQYTYLSRALNPGKTHLNEDHLFQLCQELQLLPEEIDYLALLRAREVTQSETRRTYLTNRIKQLARSQELSAEQQNFQPTFASEEMNYLFDPLCIIVHASLFNADYAANPRRLCTLLGISPARLSECLQKLEKMHFIEMDSGENNIRTKKGKIHYGPAHPLMRTHQHLLRSFSQSQLMRLPESKRHSFLITFATNASTQEFIQSRFQSFLKEIEQAVQKSSPETVYQLNFDLFTWL